MTPRAAVPVLGVFIAAVALKASLAPPPVDIRPAARPAAAPAPPGPQASLELYEPACDLLATLSVLEDHIEIVEALRQEVWTLVSDVESLWADWKRYGGAAWTGWRGLGSASARTPERVRAEKIHAGLFRLYEDARTLHDDAYRAMTELRRAEGAWRRLRDLPPERLPEDRVLAARFRSLRGELARLAAALNALDAGLRLGQEDLDGAYADVRRHLLESEGTVPSLPAPSHWERLAGERPRPSRRYDFAARYAGHWLRVCPELPVPDQGY